MKVGFLRFSVMALLLVAHLVVVSPVDAAPRSADTAFQNARTNYLALKRRDPRVKSLLDWERVAKDFQNYLEAYPRHHDRPRALFLVGQLYENTFAYRSFRTGLVRAIYYYEELAKAYRGNRLADDALLALGDLRRDGLGDEVAARAAYYEIVDVYPDGDMIKEASRRLGVAPPGGSSGKRTVSKTSAAQKAASSKRTEKPVTEKALEKTVQKKKKEKGFLASLFNRKPKEGEGKEIVSKATNPGKRPLIVIDPGHGGDDEGAKGVQGSLEKEVVLNVSAYLDELLRERLRAETVMTRVRDVALPLSERTHIANKHNADLFISVHANASRYKTAKGVETYYLDNTNDSSSLKLATRENESFQKSKDDLQFILSDLIQTGKLDESISLAHHIQNALHVTLKRYYKDVKNLGVKKAPFYVLVGAHMPCVLVEISFLDHPTEGRRLITPRYQKLVAQGIYQGVRDYFEVIENVPGSFSK